MRRFLTLLLSFIPLAGQTPAAKPRMDQPEPAFLAGKVFNAATKGPVSRALVIARRTTPGNPQQQPGYTTSTDPEGRFAMKDLTPGTYRLSVQRNGYVVAEYGAKRVSGAGVPFLLEAGQRLTSLEVPLTPHGVISGRIQDEFGEPVARATVSALRFGYQNTQGRKQSISAGSATTNDLGEFRIFGLAPGRYFVVARDSSTLSGGTASEDRSASATGPQEEYVPTFYPRGTSLQSAVQVEAVAGGSAQGVNLTLAKARPVRVRGRLANETGVAAARTNILLLPRDPMGYPNILTAAIGAQGQFEFRKLVPGQYSLSAAVYPGGPETQPLTTHSLLDVGNEDIDNLIVTIRAPVDVAGSVAVEGEQKINLAGLRVSLSPAEPVGLTMGIPAAATVNAEGGFQLRNASPDAQLVSVTGFAATHYVKAIRYGEADALEMPLLPAGGGKLTIVLGANAGTISVTAVDGDRKAVPGATVVLIPAAEKRRRLSSFYRSSVTDQTGAYSFAGLPPGAYRLFAWDDVEQGAWMDPEFLAGLDDAGKKVTIEEGSRESLEVRVIASPQR